MRSPALRRMRTVALIVSVLALLVAVVPASTLAADELTVTNSGLNQYFNDADVAVQGDRMTFERRVLVQIDATVDVAGGVAPYRVAWDAPISPFADGRGVNGSQAWITAKYDCDAAPTALQATITDAYGATATSGTFVVAPCPDYLPTSSTAGLSSTAATRRAPIVASMDLVSLVDINQCSYGMTGYTPDFSSIFANLGASGTPTGGGTGCSSAAFDVTEGGLYNFVAVANGFGPDGSNVTVLRQSWAQITVGPGVEFSAFSAPVANEPVVNAIKAGRAATLQFAVSVDGVPDTDPSELSVAATQVECLLGVEVRPLTSTLTKGSTAIKYIKGIKKFGYDWLAPAGRSAIGSCWDVSFTTIFGGFATAHFIVTR
jgi:hypothetical protein